MSELRPPGADAQPLLPYTLNPKPSCSGMYGTSFALNPKSQHFSLPLNRLGVAAPLPQMWSFFLLLFHLRRRPANLWGGSPCPRFLLLGQCSQHLGRHCVHHKPLAALNPKP